MKRFTQFLQEGAPPFPVQTNTTNPDSKNDAEIFVHILQYCGFTHDSEPTIPPHKVYCEEPVTTIPYTSEGNRGLTVTSVSSSVQVLSVDSFTRRLSIVNSLNSIHDLVLMWHHGFWWDEYFATTKRAWVAKTAQLVFGNRFVSVDPNAISITLKDGRTEDPLSPYAPRNPAKVDIGTYKDPFEQEGS